MTRPASVTLSVVVPMYNEQDVLALFAQRLRPLLDGSGERYEVVAVDDGSVDATPALLIGLRRQWPELRVIRLRRNAGHQAALTAGLHNARGEYVVSLDADLQDPPEKILEMLCLAREQRLDIVYGVRADRTSDTFFKRYTAAAYYWLMRRVAGDRVPNNAGDFRLLSRATVDALKDLPERQLVFRLVIPWLGFPSGQISYVREQRAAGTTKYPLAKMARLAVDSVTSFSAAPLRLATLLGLGSVLLCCGLLLFGLVAFVLGVVVPGWTSLFAVILFLGGVQMLCLGLLGEYIGRIYSTVQGRPAYFIETDSLFGSAGGSATAGGAPATAGGAPAPAGGAPAPAGGAPAPAGGAPAPAGGASATALLPQQQVPGRATSSQVDSGVPAGELV